MVVLALLAEVNDASDPMPYGERRQALGVLAGSSVGPKVDARLQLVLDMKQAADSDAPCKTWTDARAAMSAADDPYFADALRSTAAPDGCAGETAKAAPAAEPQESAASPEVARASKSKKKAKRSRTKSKATPASAAPAPKAEAPKPKKKTSKPVIPKLDTGLRSIPAP